jgi:hypothetical protein
MKKNSKKKVLLSSVAMLMVGAVSLGTATFAWFTNNKIVTADGMNVTSAAARGLQITGTNGEATADKTGDALATNEAQWGPTANFPTTTAVIQPISVDYSKDTVLEYDKLKDGFYPGDVKNTGAYADNKKSDFTGWKEAVDAFPLIEGGMGAEAVGHSDNYVAYEVGIRATGDDIENVKLDVNVKDAAASIGANASKYMRVAILEQGTSNEQDYKKQTIKTVIGHEPVGVTPNAVSAVSVSQDTTNPDGTKQESATLINQLIEGKVDDKGVLSLKNINIGKVTQIPTYYTILVWFEGQDGQCIDDFTSATGNIDLKFFYTDATTPATP